MLRRILLLINPMAGRGRAGKQLAPIQAELDRFNVQVSVLKSTAPGSLRQNLQQSRLEGYDAVVAAGGDGTLCEVLNGLMLHRSEERPPLGILPIGTGNAFSRDLGLAAGDWRTALARLLQAQARPVDVGQLDCKQGRYHFLNIAGVGFVVDAGITAAKLKGIGRSAYTLAALWQTLKLPTWRLRVQCGEQVFDQDSLFAEFSNSRYTGTSFLMAPSARLDDGLLDLTLVRRMPRLRLLWLFPTIYSGEHVRFPEVVTMQAAEFQVLEPVGCPMMIDGEFVAETPAVVRCLPGEIRLLG